MAGRPALTIARKATMRNALLAGAFAVAVSAASAQADQSVPTYHGALDRAGRYVVPGLTYERARGLHLDPSFHAAFEGHQLPKFAAKRAVVPSGFLRQAIEREPQRADLAGVAITGDDHGDFVVAELLQADVHGVTVDDDVGGVDD